MQERNNSKFKYIKRLVSGEIRQLWLLIDEEDGQKHIWYKAEAEYYGEGIRKGEMVEIELDEFRNLGRYYNCFEKKELILPLHSSSSL